eukprot:353857-Chlamydomonas_euryale.AAC.7
MVRAAHAAARGDGRCGRQPPAAAAAAAAAADPTRHRCSRSMCGGVRGGCGRLQWLAPATKVRPHALAHAPSLRACQCVPALAAGRRRGRHCMLIRLSTGHAHASWLLGHGCDHAQLCACPPLLAHGTHARPCSGASWQAGMQACGKAG